MSGQTAFWLLLLRTVLGVVFLTAFASVGSELRGQPLREQVRGKYHLWIAESDTDRHVIRKIIRGSLVKDKPPVELDDFAGHLIAQWLVANTGSDNFIQILPEFVQFLIWDAKKPPFSMGSPVSPRFQILSALETALIKRATPVALAALLLFGEVDDAEHRNRAREADYTKLGSYGWLLAGVPWVRLYIDGLNPDWGKREYWSNPSYPLVTDQAKAGVLPWARSVLAELSFQRPYPFAFGFNVISSIGRLRGLDSIKGQQAPITPEQVNAASNEWEDVFKLLLKDGLNFIGKGAAFENWNLKRYQFYSGERAIHPLPFVSLEETGSIVADALQEFTGNPTRERFDERGNIKVESASLAQFIVNRLIEQRAVGLYSLALARARGLKTPSPSAIDGDPQKFLTEHAKELDVTTQIATDLKDAPLSDISRETAGCDIEELALKSRRVDLVSRRYQETFRRTCKSGQVSDVKVNGIVPAWAWLALNAELRTFDIANTSLAAIQFAEGALDAADRVDWELISGRPASAIEHLLAYQYNPSLSWSLIREGLVVQSADELSWLFDPPKPGILNLDKGNFFGGFEGINVAPDEATFQASAASMMEHLRTILTNRAQVQFYSRINPVVRRLPDELTETRSIPCSDGHGTCGFQRGHVRNRFKDSMIARLNDLEREIKSMGWEATEFWSGALSSKCTGNPRDTDSSVSVYMHPDLSRYHVHYHYFDATTDESCGYFFPNNLITLPASVIDVLKSALLRDPKFLKRYGLDLQETGTGMKERLTRAISNEKTERLRFEEGFRALTYYGVSGWLKEPKQLFPFSFPYDNYFDSGIYGSYGLAVSIGGKHVGIESLRTDELFGSAGGIVMANALNIIANLQSSVRPQEPFEVPSSFMAPVLRAVGVPFLTALDAARQTADRQATEIINAINAAFNPPSGWSIGITWGYSGGNPLGGISVGVGSFNISLGLSVPTQLTVVPSWEGIKVPLPVIRPPGSNLRETSIRLTRDKELIGLSVDFDPAGNPHSLFQVPWTAVPPVMLGPNLNLAQNGTDRAWLAGAIARAWDVLSADERKRVLVGLNSSAFPSDLAELVADKAVEGSTKIAIASGNYYVTEFEESLLPLRQPGRPCPASGCIDNTDPAINRYIDDYNSGASDAFTQQKDQAGRHAVDGRPFRDGIPGVKLTYGNNFTIMRRQLAFALADGSGVIERDELFRTPIFILGRVRANPFGHEYEKWTQAISVVGQTWPNDAPPENDYIASQKSIFFELRERIELARKVGVDPALDNYKADVLEAFKQFWQRWTAFTSDTEKSPDRGTLNEFMPPRYGEPFLNFFQPPWMYYHNYDGMNWLIYRNGSAVPDQLSAHLPAPKKPR